MYFLLCSIFIIVYASPLKINLNKRAKKIAPATPPIKPTRLLLGLAATIPLVDLPKRIPNNHAHESVINTRTRKRLIIYFESGSRVILEMKVKRKPQ